MHILVLPSWYASEESPNSGSFFREQAQALARLGHKVSVLVIRSSNSTETVREKHEQGGITEYYLCMKSLPFHLTGALVMGELLRLFHREFRAPKVDIIQVQSYRCGRYARFLRAVYRIPYVVTEHFAGIRTGKRREEARKVYAAAAAVIAVSPGLRETVRELCPREVLLIPNMVSERFFSVGLREDRKDETFRFVCTGNLEDPDKGIDVLLRAFAKLRARMPRTSLTVIGGGDRGPFDALAAELGISDGVTFTGLISREAVSRQLRRSQAFVLLSRVETFGVCYLEALACGLPIVMTKTDAWEMLVSPETGIAVDINDADAAAEAMEQIIRGYERYDPVAISAYCKERFSEQSVCRELTEVYGRVLSRR